MCGFWAGKPDSCASSTFSPLETIDNNLAVTASQLGHCSRLLLSTSQRFFLCICGAVPARRSSSLVTPDHHIALFTIHVLAMQAAVSDNVQAVEKAAQRFGPRLDQATTLLKSMFTQASNVEATTSELRTSDHAAKLGSQLGLVDDIQEALSDTDVLYHHIIAITEASAAFSWIVSEEPVAHLAAHVAEMQPILTSLRDMADPSHTQLADAVDAFVSTLTLYVGRNPAALNFIQVASSPCNTDAGASHSSPHLADFRDAVTDAAVCELKNASDALAAPFCDHARNLCSAVSRMYGFIVAASVMPKRATEAERGVMLGPIIECMSSISARTEQCVPTDPFFNHFKAIEDAMAMLSWIVAEEKPTLFITEAEGTASFYLNKILMDTKKDSNAAAHKRFVDALNALFVAMRAYIKEHHPTGLRYGLGLETAATSDNPSKRMPFAEDEPADDDYVSAFNALLTGPLAAYIAVSAKIGGPVAEQASAFEHAWKAEAEFLSEAIAMPKPADVQSLVTPLGEKLGAVAQYIESVDPRSPFAQHVTAVGESVHALGWVAVDEKATVFVADMAGAGQFFIDKVKMNAKKTDNPTVQREWASCLEALWVELKAYVKEHHTQCLIWNPPKRKKSSSSGARAQDVDEEDISSDYVTAFNEIVSSSVSKFVSACDRMGSAVAKQGRLFEDAFKAEADFLCKAIEMAEPEDIQGMLTPIASKMEAIGAICEEAGPRDAYGSHLNAVSESMAALGWVAVPEKATVFVADMAGAGQFFIDKVKMGAKKTDQCELHREWASSLETVWKDLKSYVKEYHTQKLAWNLGKQKKAKRSGVSHGDADDGGGSGHMDFVAAFNEIVTGRVGSFVKISETIGGEVGKQAGLFEQVWAAEADFLKKAQSMKKPDDVQAMIGPIGGKMGEVVAITERVSPRDTHANHLNAVSEAMQALGWVMVDEKATVFVSEMASAGQFYIDKVKMGAKNMETPSVHKEWATCLEALWADLKAYVKEFHTQKLTWKG